MNYRKKNLLYLILVDWQHLLTLSKFIHGRYKLKKIICMFVVTKATPQPKPRKPHRKRG